MEKLEKKKIAFVLGIRPDVIRAALILKYLRSYKEVETTFIWSGQHYSDNLKGVFFRELGVESEHVNLGCTGSTDAEIVASVVVKLYECLANLRPDACVFLGDTNTTTGSLACAQLNIPIIHIEGCMRSYDWRMPEEKYRTVIDHLSDVIYAYFPEYKEQGIREGIAPDKIVVVGNPIVDILNHFYFSRLSYFEALASMEFFSSRGLEKQKYYVMTSHRRENVENRNSLQAILELAGAAPYPVFFPASYRTQKEIKASGLRLNDNIKMTDPVGYEEILALIVNSRGCLTDSGTVVEETCVLQVPSVQMRRSTERPQVYDAKSSVKFDPTRPNDFPAKTVLSKLDSLFGKKWVHGLGDGQTSKIIAEDLRQRAINDGFRKHAPSDYHFDITRSYRGDGL